jgi:hypothetical protein
MLYSKVMKTLLAFLVASMINLVFALPAPQQIVIELGQPFKLAGLDSATFESMMFDLSSVTMTGSDAQVLVRLTLGSEEAETLMLETPIAASIEVGDYTLTLLGASVPEDADMSCAVSTATLVLEKTEKPL